MRATHEPGMSRGVGEIPAGDRPALADQDLPDHDFPVQLSPDHDLPDQLLPVHQLSDQLLPDQDLPVHTVVNQLPPSNRRRSTRRRSTSVGPRRAGGREARPARSVPRLPHDVELADQLDAFVGDVLAATGHLDRPRAGRRGHDWRSLANAEVQLAARH